VASKRPVERRRTRARIAGDVTHGRAETHAPATAVGNVIGVTPYIRIGPAKKTKTKPTEEGKNRWRKVGIKGAAKVANLSDPGRAIARKKRLRGIGTQD